MDIAGVDLDLEAILDADTHVDADSDLDLDAHACVDVDANADPVLNPDGGANADSDLCADADATVDVDGLKIQIWIQTVMRDADAGTDANGGGDIHTSRILTCSGNLASPGPGAPPLAS